MSVEILDCEQGTPEWLEARRGIPTASEFATVMAQGKTKGSPSVTRRKYMLQLIGERMGAQLAESYTNPHMERGKAMEAQARSLYAFARGAEPRQVGFIRNGDKGCSPDSLIGDDGMLEIKTKLPHLQIECLLDGVLPSEHKPQVQGELWVAERQWCDFESYWPGLPPLIVRVERDEAYIQTIEDAVAKFNAEMAETQRMLEAMYATKAAA